MYRMVMKFKRHSIIARSLFLLCWGSTLSFIIIMYVRTPTLTNPNMYLGVSIDSGRKDPVGRNSSLQYSATPTTRIRTKNCHNKSTNSLSKNSMPSDCQKKHCSEFLTQKEMAARKRCAREVFRQMDPLDIKKSLKANDCHFTDGKNRLPVALVSAEGSGNTWVRGLLEKATGICTGFLHCDYVMRQNGFIGEAIKSGSVLAVKTHAIQPQWIGMEYSSPNPKQGFFGSAILIVRNPYKSLIAEWNRRVTNLFLIPNGLEHNESHTNTVPEEYWRIPEWDAYIRVYTEAWRERIKNWLLQNHAKTIVVRYEDIKTNTLNEVTRMLDFLNISYSSKEEVENRICEGFSEFKRPQNDVGFEHYSWEQKQYIQSVIQETKLLFEEKGDLLNLNYEA